MFVQRSSWSHWPPLTSAEQIGSAVSSLDWINILGHLPSTQMLPVARTVQRVGGGGGEAWTGLSLPWDRDDLSNTLTHLGIAEEPDKTL